MTSFAVSCQHGNGGQTAIQADSPQSHQTDSADSAYRYNICFALYYKANDFFNRNESDSLEMMVPDALKTCLELRDERHYYLIWEKMAEYYVWNNQFEKAVAEAQRMQEDALKRDNQLGLFNSYKVLGTAYAYKENFSESAKVLSKAVESFPEGEFIGPLVMTYRLYYEVLSILKKEEEADSLLRDWKTQMEGHRISENSKDSCVWGIWNFFYQTELANCLRKKGDFKGADQSLDSAEYYNHIGGDEPLNLMKLLVNRSELAREMGDYKTALKYTEREIALAREYGDNSNVILGMAERCLTLEAFGRYRDAIKLYHEMDAFKDSLNEADTHAQLNELNKRFELNELKMQAERQQM